MEWGSVNAAMIFIGPSQYRLVGHVGGVMPNRLAIGLADLTGHALV